MRKILIKGKKRFNELKKLSEQHGTFYEPDPLLVSMC